MFDPQNPNSVLILRDADLARLPNAEDDRHEFQSSAVRDPDLAHTISKAASAFWNSGGGLFVAGVGKDGKPDGGLSPQAGRQPRREWIEAVLHGVTPADRFCVHEIENDGACPGIGIGKAVFLIAFGVSETAPHMAADRRYYLRAGADTLPASSFIVESIWARRNLPKPRLMHIAQLDHFTKDSHWLNVEIVTVNDATALEVEIEISPETSLTFPLHVTAIDKLHPFSFRLEIPFQGIALEIKIKYADAAGNAYAYIGQIDSRLCVWPFDRPQTNLSRIAEAIERLNSQSSLARHFR
jgi:Putative DNA-binding domain